MSSTIIDFIVGLSIARYDNPIKRKLLLLISIIVNLGFLCNFKYYNFFLDNLVAAFSFFGRNIPKNSLNIILPVGISFYTFQTLSYSIDIYKKKLTPTKDFIVFSAFVSFFPQLVAGTIERATHLLPQFSRKRVFNYNNSVNGCRQILWGLFKKIVIADNCAKYANIIFNNSIEYSSSTLILGALFFTFQIYGDFSGYSDIAIGTSKLFGFKLMKNFDFPYFSRDVAEFWRRWHISLSTWFRDYIYIPLGGSQCGNWKNVRNIFIIFIISGFWHGAKWTFVAWGILNAIYFLPLLLLKKNRFNLDIVAKGKTIPTFKEFFQIMTTFGLTVITWIFFRAENLRHALCYIRGIFSKTFFSIPDFPTSIRAFRFIPVLFFFIIIEWIGRENDYAIEKIGSFRNTILRRSFTGGAILLLLYFGNFAENKFIYFQF